MIEQGKIVEIKKGFVIGQENIGGFRLAEKIIIDHDPVPPADPGFRDEEDEIIYGRIGCAAAFPAVNASDKRGGAAPL
jgi:hypothetical protein